MGEFSLIEVIRLRCPLTRNDVRLGIGDDAAVLAVPAGLELVVCTDTLVSGVHFPEATSAYDIGWKALAVNLSDLAAMGATPAWATMALTLPSADADFVAGFADGFAALASAHDVALVGGDTTRGPLTISVTAHGFVPAGQGLRRGGARVGDLVFASGRLGDAAAALQGLGLGNPETSHAAALLDPILLERLNRPHPRVACGLALRTLAHACIDVSDGLLADLGHIARASGVAIEIDARQLPTSPALAARFAVHERLPLQLGGGDDYELAFAISPDRVDALNAAMAKIDCPVTCIGRVLAGDGVHVVGADTQLIPRGGWEHFRET